MEKNEGWLGPDLEPADRGDPVDYKGNDHHGANQVAENQGNPEQHFQRHGHDGGLDGEKDKRERGVDQRGDGGAYIAKAGTASQQVNVDAITGRVVTDRDGGEEDHQTDGQYRGDRIVESVVEGNGAADGFQCQKGDGAQGCVAYPGRGPAPGTLGGKAKRIVFQGLVGYPLVVAAPNPKNILSCRHDCLAFGV